MSGTSNEAENLAAEAAAFDDRIRERVRHGHIPDLRRVEPCDWFYNNPWRHPRFVDMVFGEYVRFLLEHLEPGSRVLEVGSGPGHLALEMARHGHRVVGVELSSASVEVAERLARENPFRDGFGDLRYVCSDILAFEDPEPFDAVCFVLSLHHFDALETVLAHVQRHLRPGGLMLVVEPARDWHDERDAAFTTLLRHFLSAAGCWHEALEPPKDEDALGVRVEEVLEEYRTATDKAEKEQSPHDNASYAETMLGALDRSCDRLELRRGYSFLPRMVGGLRGPDEASVLAMAELLQTADRYLVNRGLVSAGAFLYAGRYRGPDGGK